MADRGNGPEADYPVVLGDPFKVDGIEYTPDNSWNYDAVGYATTDQAAGISASHKTLPLPSYVEVTSLESGKRVLIRVERRGPMTNARLIALSPDAQALLGASDATPVRVRRVNPPENERFALRSGGAASPRIDTPNSLVQVLRRKLPASGSTSLASTAPAKPTEATNEEDSEPSIAVAPNPEPTATPTSTPSATATATATAASTPTTAPKPPASTTQPAMRGRFAVQAAAFKSKASAERAAKAINGFVKSGGGYHRVRTGPYANRGQAEAALAKVRAAGYSDAQVVTAG
ncbi:MAG: SPOR domain-containing protein [Erythrobacter sp.]